jgi:hypothetical protein
MKPVPTPLRIACALLTAAAVFVSCTTVNNLDQYRFDGARVAADLRVPPEPEVRVSYSVDIDKENPVATAMSVGTSIAKAAEAQKAEKKMRNALRDVDVPRIVLDESFARSLDALDAEPATEKRYADYVLDIEIEEYGINAGSPGGAVSLSMTIVARMYHRKGGELVWRRRVDQDQPASPFMFGMDHIVGNVLTAGVLANLSEEQMAIGFERLALESARSVARRLEDDLYKALYSRR